MRFICSTFGSSGDVFPMLGLAMELRNRGHEVTFATNSHYEKVVSDNSLPFEALGNENDFQACIRNSDLWHPRKAFPHIFKSLKSVLPRQYEIHEQLSRLGPVCGITNCFGFGALLAQEKLSIPVITLHLQPVVLWSDIEPPSLPGVSGPKWWRRLLFRVGEKYAIDPVVCPFINQWRRELDLPPMRQTMRWWNSPFGVLCMFPDWYAKRQNDWPSNLMQTDFPLWNDRADQKLDEKVESFLNLGEAPIVFTPGSANIHGRRFFESAIQSTIALQRRAILLTEFAEQIPDGLPSHIAHFSYIPLDLLLPRSLAFVHHGGIGSTSQAILAGIPQVLMPLAHDQFDNANRIMKFGIGDSIPMKQITARKLQSVLQSLLSSAAVKLSSEDYALKLRNRNGLTQSAIAVEERLRSHRSL